MPICVGPSKARLLALHQSSIATDLCNTYPPEDRRCTRAKYRSMLRDAAGGQKLNGRLMWGWSRCAVLTLLLFAFAANAVAGPLEAMRAGDEKFMSGTAARETKPAAYVSFDHGGAPKGEVTVGDGTIKMTVRGGSGNLHHFRLGVQV